MLKGWLVLSLAACRGEEVNAAPADSGIAETEAAIVADTASDAAVCTATNLIPNGDFTSGINGWTANDCSTETIATAPCGRGLRMFSCKQYGDIHRRVVRKLAAKATVRLRVYFRASGVNAPRPPAALVRLFRAADAGEIVDEELNAIGTREVDWTMSEATLTLDKDHDGFDVTVVSGVEAATGTDEFAVASLTLETL